MTGDQKRDAEGGVPGRPVNLQLRGGGKIMERQALKVVRRSRRTDTNPTPGPTTQANGNERPPHNLSTAPVTFRVKV